MRHPVLHLRRSLRDARYRLGRCLIRPEADRIIAYYQRAAEQQVKGSFARTRLSYTAIGAEYVANGWPRRCQPVQKEQ
jgi:hypothetical protein